MIVDIGGGTRKSRDSLSGIVYASPSASPATRLDEAIVQYIKKHYNLLVGERQRGDQDQARLRLPDRRRHGAPWK